LRLGTRLAPGQRQVLLEAVRVGTDQARFAVFSRKGQCSGIVSGKKAAGI